jgi:hypothetical protein
MCTVSHFLKSVNFEYSICSTDSSSSLPILLYLAVFLPTFLLWISKAPTFWNRQNITLKTYRGEIWNYIDERNSPRQWKKRLAFFFRCPHGLIKRKKTGLSLLSFFSWSPPPPPSPPLCREYKDWERGKGVIFCRCPSKITSLNSHDSFLSWLAS